MPETTLKTLQRPPVGELDRIAHQIEQDLPETGLSGLLLPFVPACPPFVPKKQPFVPFLTTAAGFSGNVSSIGKNAIFSNFIKERNWLWTHCC